MHMQNKINVMFITPGFTMGGAERWILSLVKNFKNVNTKRIFVSLGHYDESLVAEAKKYTEVIINDWRITNPNIAIKDHLAEIDVIISWGCSNLKEMVDTFTGPVVEVSHNDPSWKSQTELLDKSSIGASHLVGVSKNASQSFPKHLRKEATVLYNGIEPTRTQPHIGRKEQRKIWGIEDQKVILFLSRLSPVKNPGLLIDALEYLPDDYVVFMIENGELYSQYKSRASDRIRFISPSIFVGDYFAASDVLVLPSLHEGMPLVLLEAWCAGLPTVSTEYKTYKELVDRHGCLGWSVPVRCDPKLLAENIHAAIEYRTDNRVQLARKVVLEEYTVQKMVFRWESYLNDILKNWSKSRFHLLRSPQFYMT